jgi:hypothetical protein
MHPPVDRFNADEWQNARRVIASLTSKSAKAQQKLAPGTWQHKMLGDNLKALHIASALIDDRVAIPCRKTGGRRCAWPRH